jgi:hypothetical protein
MLKQMQQDMLGAVYGDAASFANTAARLAPAAVDPVRALYLHTATVTAALTGVLAQAYPAVHAVMGEAGFSPLATRFMRERPPTLPVLSAYGAGFADILPDSLRVMARFDWAAHLAYFAADVVPLSPETLASLPSDSLGGLDLRPVPSVSLLRGCDPAPWLPHRPDLVVVPAPFESPAVAALVWRQPDLLVAACPLDGGLSALMDALGQGAGLLAAAEVGLAAGLSDLPAALAFLLNQGLLTLPEEMAP